MKVNYLEITRKKIITDLALSDNDPLLEYIISVVGMSVLDSTVDNSISEDVFNYFNQREVL